MRRRQLSDRTKQEMRTGAARVFSNSHESLREARKGLKRWAQWRERDAWIRGKLVDGEVSLVPEILPNGLPSSDPKRVVVQVGLCLFSDPVGSFPSAKLVANVGLAIQAGQHLVTTLDVVHEAMKIAAEQQRGSK